MTAVLELSGVSAGYGPFKALFDVSLAVQPGEALALLGANGAGKTTVARVASGLVRPTAGSVTVEGRTILYASSCESPTPSPFGEYTVLDGGVEYTPE